MESIRKTVMTRENIMKRIISALLSILLVTGVILGCGNTEKPGNTQITSKEDESSNTDVSTTDVSEVTVSEIKDEDTN